MSKKDITNSPKIQEIELETLKGLFPQFFSEGNFDIESFKSYLEGQATDNNEFYRFEWTGKKNAKQIASKPTKNTLIPDIKNSKNWDTTENLFIEGDNLEVLKLLLNKYYGQIKMIYIDPPYNKDKDFVYKDTWKDNLEDYLSQTGQVDEDGETTTEKETTGRKHSNWLNMMYPRLILARKLLKEDGVIFVSIDDAEVHNLRKVMDEVFGPDNFIAQILVDGTPKNDPFFVATSHEYCLLYTKEINEAKTCNFGVKNPLFDNILKIYNDNGVNYKKIEEELIKFYYTLDLNNLNISNYKFADKKGVFRIGPIDDPQGGGPKDERLNILTGKKCKTPNGGWRCNLETWKKWVENDLILFPEDDNNLPSKKIYITEDRIDVMQGYFKIQTRKDTDNLKRLFNLEITPFSNPKPLELIKKFIESINDNNAIILDFFAGSGTTANAVMDLNKDGGNRKFICIQIPEKLSLKGCKSNKERKITESAINFLSSISKPLNISEISKERIRRVGDKIKTEVGGKNVDIGFRIFCLVESNFKYMSEKYEINENTNLEQMELLMKKEVEESGLIEGRTEIDVIYELIIREGYSFYSGIEKLDNGIYKICDENKYFYTLIKEKLSEEKVRDFVKNHLEEKQVRFFALEESLSESARATLDTYFSLQNI